MLQTAQLNTTTVEGIHPGAYRITEIDLTNSYGKSFDIKALVTQLTILESIYAFALTGKLEIKDTINLFEEMRLSGQETVAITFQKRERNSKDTIKIKKHFYVSEIPLYGKSKDAVQAYVLKIVSKHAFINNIKSISRSFNGSISKMISNIVTNTLAYDGVVENTVSSKDNVKLIVPNMKPFAAITWLLRHSFSEKDSPVYAYETMDGFKINSHADLFQLSSIGTYRYTFIQGDNPYSDTGYQRLKYKIIDMASDLNSSKYLNSGKGAYASTTKVLDYATKSYYNVFFDYDNTFSNTSTVNGLKSKKLLSQKFKVDGETLNRSRDSLQIYINANSKSYNNYKNYHEPAIHSLGHHQSQLENLDNTKHDITIHGDLEIHPGQKITITAPKSIDPQVFNKIKDKDAKKSVQDDQMISGDYLISNVIHIFADQYTCQLRLKRDFSNYSLDSVE